MCRFWDCTNLSRQGFLCLDHYRLYRRNLINECPECHQYKDAKYSHCLNCKSERPRSRYREEHSDAWEPGDAEATAFYVYALKLNNGRLYAGQTRELRERVMEHQAASRSQRRAGSQAGLVHNRRHPRDRQGSRGLGQGTVRPEPPRGVLHRIYSTCTRWSVISD